MPRHWSEKIGFAVVTMAAAIVVLPVVLVTGYIVWRGLGAISLEFLFTAPRDGLRAGGIFPAAVGTVLLTVGTAIVALPLGLLAAIYLAEYARDDPLTRLIRMAIINLAGIPSIVYGLFGLQLFVLSLHLGTSIIAGSLTLGLLTLPVVISTAEEALLSVPQSFRVVGVSLGGTRWQTIRHIVLPGALPGIITGVILGLERAAGETAPILFTVAAVYLPSLPHSLFDQTMALPYHLYVISTQVPGMPLGLQFGTALVLLALTLSLTAAATVIRSHFRRQRYW